MRTELRLLALVRPYWGMLLLGLATASLASVLDSVTIVVLIPLLKHLFGDAGALHASATSLEVLAERLTGPLLAGASPGGAVGRIALVLGAALLLKNALAYASTQISVRVQEGLVCRLRTRLFAHLLTLNLGFFQRTPGGQLISALVTEADQAKTVVTAALISFFQNAMLVVATLAVLSQISARLTLLVLAVLPPLVLVVRALLRRLRRHARARTEERGEITAAVAERIAAIRLIRTSATAAAESEHFGGLADHYRRKVIRTQRYSALTRPVSELFAGAIVMLIVWAGANPAVIGLRSLAPEAIIVFLLAAIKLLSPLKALTQFPALMALALASAERVFAVLDQSPADVDRPGETDARFEREIVYDQVSYRYEGEHDVLRGISFAVRRGQVVALVGPSGAGKSTVIDLLPRLDDPTSGRILLDGVPLPSFRRRSLRSLMGVVSQETVLLHDSVHANIAYGVPGATRAQVEAAARTANADEFIRRLPRGYDTPLGERGTRLSGGQRQRIAIARALLRDPPILLLDEATSALDSESERLLQQAIERLMEDRTVLVIAHRLATVRHADLILVLERGRIVQRGTHEELLREGGLYGRLHALEFHRFRTSAPALLAPRA